MFDIVHLDVVPREPHVGTVHAHTGLEIVSVARFARGDKCVCATQALVPFSHREQLLNLDDDLRITGGRRVAELLTDAKRLDRLVKAVENLRYEAAGK